MVYVNCSQTLPVWNEKCWLYIEWQHFYIIILFLRLFVCLFVILFYYCCLLLVNKVAYSITFCNQSYISPLYEIKTNIQFIHRSALEPILYHTQCSKCSFSSTHASCLKSLTLFINSTVNNALPRASIKRCLRSAKSRTGVQYTRSCATPHIR